MGGGGENDYDESMSGKRGGKRGREGVAGGRNFFLVNATSLFRRGAISNDVNELALTVNLPQLLCTLCFFFLPALFFLCISLISESFHALSLHGEKTKVRRVT